MPIHNFDADFTVRPDSAPNIPVGLPSDPSLYQTAHSEGGRVSLDGSGASARTQYVQEFTTSGFRALDESVKHYWTGIRVPTKDSYRLLRVKIAGGDKSLLVWADDLKEGRARLPVASISRTSHEFMPEKYSPTYFPMTYRHLNTEKSLAAQVFRPVPYLVSYEMTIWTERKRDIEHIMYQVLTRFNPLVEFRMFDGHLRGSVYLRYKGMSDTSDKEVGYDAHANVKYELNFDAEAWLPLPERIVPTVRGVVTALREVPGQILAMDRIGSSDGNEVGLKIGNNSVVPLQTFF